jgi:hypothetical protein
MREATSDRNLRYDGRCIESYMKDSPICRLQCSMLTRRASDVRHAQQARIGFCIPRSDRHAFQHHSSGCLSIPPGRLDLNTPMCKDTLSTHRALSMLSNDHTLQGVRLCNAPPPLSCPNHSSHRVATPTSPHSIIPAIKTPSHTILL